MFSTKIPTVYSREIKRLVERLRESMTNDVSLDDKINILLKRNLEERNLNNKLLD